MSSTNSRNTSLFKQDQDVLSKFKIQENLTNTIIFLKQQTQETKIKMVSRKKITTCTKNILNRFADTIILKSKT